MSSKTISRAPDFTASDALRYHNSNPLIDKTNLRAKLEVKSSMTEEEQLERGIEAAGEELKMHEQQMDSWDTSVFNGTHTASKRVYDEPKPSWRNLHCTGTVRCRQAPCSWHHAQRDEASVGSKLLKPEATACTRGRMRNLSELSVFGSRFVTPFASTTHAMSPSQVGDDAHTSRAASGVLFA